LAAEVRRRGLDTVDGAFGFVGGEDLDKAGLGARRRTRLRVPDGTGGERELYLKRYGPACWRRGRSPAAAEADGIAAARSAGVATMRLLAAGEDAPTRRSFVLVTAVPGEALERCGAAFLERHEEAPAAVDALTAGLAALVRGLHGAGLVHRDLYASHVFLTEGPDGQALHLIDMARMLYPRVRPFRWRVKDLAALKYSMPAVWVDGWWAAFLAAYLGDVSARVRQRWERAIGRKAARITRHDRRRASRKG
jgi:tRNA A-37 threonylcarbamoyl transferase component Bud32